VKEGKPRRELSTDYDFSREPALLSIYEYCSDDGIKSSARSAKAKQNLQKTTTANEIERPTRISRSRVSLE